LQYGVQKESVGTHPLIPSREGNVGKGSWRRGIFLVEPLNRKICGQLYAHPATIIRTPLLGEPAPVCRGCSPLPGGAGGGSCAVHTGTVWRVPSTLYPWTHP